MRGVIAVDPGSVKLGVCALARCDAGFRVVHWSALGDPGELERELQAALSSLQAAGVARERVELVAETQHSSYRGPRAGEGFALGVASARLGLSSQQQLRTVPGSMRRRVLRLVTGREVPTGPRAYEARKRAAVDATQALVAGTGACPDLRAAFDPCSLAAWEAERSRSGAQSRARELADTLTLALAVATQPPRRARTKK